MKNQNQELQTFIARRRLKSEFSPLYEPGPPLALRVCVYFGEVLRQNYGVIAKMDSE